MIRRVLVLAVVALFATAASALADAPDPIVSQTHLTQPVVHNSNGTFTITIAGGWQWTTHHSDCNTNRSGVGYAIDWHDPSDPGNPISKNGISANVGTASDNVVHPVPGPTVPNPTDISSPSQFQSWRGGCGTFNGTFNTGTWGPISHTYPANFTGPIVVCPIMFDVHGNSAGTAPNGAKEVTAGGQGHNGDNSIETNGDTPLGNGCFTTVIPQLTTTASGPSVVNNAISDVAHLSGGTSPTGTITFTAYGPTDTACAGPPVYTSSAIPVNGNGDYTSSPAFTPTMAGTYRWIATYSGDSHNSGVPTACNDNGESTVVAPAAPAITILKQQAIAGSGNAPTHNDITGNAGQTVNYLMTVTNTGNVPLTLTLTDAHCDSGTITGPTLVKGNLNGTTLSPNGVVSYACTHAIVSSDAPVFTNEADVSGQPPSGSPVTAKDSVNLDVTLHPALTIVKSQRNGSSGSFTTATISGQPFDTINYSTLVTNTGDTPLLLAFSDPKCDPGTLAGPFGGSFDNAGRLNPGSSVTFTCSHVLQVSDAPSFTNTASVTGTPPTGPVVTPPPSSVTVNLQLTPGIKVVKLEKIDGGSADFAAGPISGAVGQKVDYEIQATNTGNEALTLALDDPHCDAGTITGPTQVSGTLNGTTLSTNSTAAYFCSHVLTSSDAPSFTNVGTVTGTPPSGPPVSGNGTVVTNLLQAAIKIVKEQKIDGSSADFTHDPISGQVGQKVDYTMTVTNTGDQALTLNFSDPHCDSGTLVGPSGGIDANGQLPAGSSTQFTCSHVLASGDVPQFVNVGTVTGTPTNGPPAGPVSDQVVANVSPPPAPPHTGITVVKMQRIAGTTDAFTTGNITAKVGDTILYQMTVSNTGDLPLALNFSDPHCDAGTLTGPAGGIDSNGLLAAHDSTVFNCSHVVAAADVPAFTNVSTVTGTPPGGTPVGPVSSTVTANVAQQQVAAAPCVAGAVGLGGTVGCARRAFQAVVQAAPNSIKSVTFVLDGKTIRTLTHAGAGNRWAIRINPAKLRFGGHTLVAHVTLICNGVKRTAVLHFRHCKPPKPRFTG